MFEDCDQREQTESICHCYRDTEIDNKSHVFNGDVTTGNEQSVNRKHHMRGGSVKNQSKFVNGDIDRDAFLAFFCDRREQNSQVP